MPELAQVEQAASQATLQQVPCVFSPAESTHVAVSHAMPVPSMLQDAPNSSRHVQRPMLLHIVCSLEQLLGSLAFVMV
jgi:hypothetical protein